MSLQQVAKFGLFSVVMFDVLWFVRLGITKLLTMLRKKISPLDESVILSFCSTHDLDFYGHMNNARYFRELDFGRFDLWFRSGLGSYIQRQPSWYVVQHAATIRYRRSINFLRPFVVRSRIVWWDERSIYFEQRMQTLHDGFIRAVALSKSTVVNGDVPAMMKTFNIEKPSIAPMELEKWLESNDISSEKLRIQYGAPSRLGSPRREAPQMIPEKQYLSIPSSKLSQE